MDRTSESGENKPNQTKPKSPMNWLNQKRNGHNINQAIKNIAPLILAIGNVVALEMDLRKCWEATAARRYHHLTFQRSNCNHPIYLSPANLHWIITQNVSMRCNCTCTKFQRLATDEFLRCLNCSKQFYNGGVEIWMKTTFFWLIQFPFGDYCQRSLAHTNLHFLFDVFIFMSWFTDFISFHFVWNLHTEKKPTTAQNLACFFLL